MMRRFLLSLLLLISILSCTLCKNTTKCECGIENENAIGKRQASPFSKLDHIPPSMARITNAEVAPEQKFPWIVYIETNFDNKTHTVTRTCTGSIISPKHILTAAHCLFPNQGASDVKVFLFQGCGKMIKSMLKTPIKVSKVYEHPDYDRSTESGASTSDIAIFRLKNDLMFSHRLSPVCLSDKRFKDDKEINNLIAAGWGKTNKGLELHDSDCLRYADLGLVHGSQCEDQYGAIDTDMTMCAGGKTNICDGDSGGPLMTRTDGRLFQVGVTSFGVEDCGLVSGIASGFERVSSHIDWIKKVTGSDVCFG
jgi:secreted trypsin-like serine protease